jgi:hypothetical protein
MAQEVQAVMPQAVARDRDGYLTVFYDKLGVTFQTYDHWIASGARVPVLGAPQYLQPWKAGGRRGCSPSCARLAEARLIFHLCGRQVPAVLLMLDTIA